MANDPLMTGDTFRSLIYSLKRGQKLVYHVGSLMADRQRPRQGETIRSTAMAAWKAYEMGKVTLVQRYLSPSRYEYIAVIK